METNSVRVRRAFDEATGFVLELARGVPEELWSAEGLGEWNLRELFVHTSRAASTITEYASRPAERTLFSPADYYLAVLGGPDIHESVALRTREQAAGITEPLVEYLAAVFAAAGNTLQRTPAAAVLGTAAGGMTLEDYLPTRVVELIVHGTDIVAALRLRGVEPAAEPPETALRITLETLVELSVRRPATVDPVAVLRALTGRGTLPEGTNLLG